MSTTLPLFWNLSSVNKKERIDASAKLVAALEHFQSSFVPKPSPETSEDDEDEDRATKTSDGLDALNAQDVAYSIRRLIRGLASPRESSRLGFAVALTELLSRIDTVTCSQIVQILLDASKTQGSMTGQEERDVLFARLFGLTAVIQSGLLLRDTTLPSSSTAASDLASFQEVLAQLLALGEKKSWLRESAWWAVGLAVDALAASRVAWRAAAFDATVAALYGGEGGRAAQWTPEKLALTLKLQAVCPAREWKKFLAPTFKSAEILAAGNLGVVARILKEADADDDEETDLPKSGSWKPQLHFVWDALLDQVLPPPQGSSPARAAKGSFPEFFRIVVDESLFASTSSPERKYWGFQVFQKALPRVSAGDMPMLFTKNFMRSWINHLSNSDRYLHKAARQVAADIQNVVKNAPTIGFSLILQLTGVNGSRQFDKLTKTKTVETILTSMDEEGIKDYIDYLLKQVDEEPSASGNVDADDVQALNTRRAWIVEQLSALVRNGAIPKSDAWIQTILDWLAVHGLFIVTKKADKSAVAALRSLPTPAFSDDLRRACRERLLACLADLTTQTTLVRDDSKAAKVPAVASDGRLWVSRVLATIETLEKDTKHVKPLEETDEDDVALRAKAREIISRLKDVPDGRREAARGVELLLAATMLHNYGADEDDADPEALESCLDGAARMFPAQPVQGKKGKKGRKSASAGDVSAAAAQDDALPAPVDVLVDAIIGFLEKGTAYLRAAANQAFALLSGAVAPSTIDLVLTQLERRDPAELAADEDEDVDMEGSAGEDDEEGENEGDDDNGSASSSASGEEDEEDEEEADEEADLELRRKIEEALRVNGIAAATGESDDESDEELMDDDQMLAIDSQLAAAFKARAAEKRRGKGKCIGYVDAQREATHFKNRVLDLVELFVRKQPMNPLIVRLVLPLIELVVGTGPDEKQLADKATGILRSRIGKAKEVPACSAAEVADAAKALDTLHTLARKAQGADALATLSACSLFLAKVLLHASETEPVRAAYAASLHDFVARKSSRLNTAFFDEFVKKQPQAAWGLREDLVKASGEALNAYRRMQCFHLVQSLVNQVQSLGENKSEVVPFMTMLRKAILETMNGACGESSTTLQPAQAKDLLKLALVAVRQTKRTTATLDEAAAAWQPAKWTALSNTLATDDRFKASVGLQAMCKQIVQLLQESRTAGTGAKAQADKSKKEKGTAKRKADETADEEEAGKKAKHKKARKAKSASS